MNEFVGGPAQRAEQRGFNVRFDAYDGLAKVPVPQPCVRINDLWSAGNALFCNLNADARSEIA